MAAGVGFVSAWQDDLQPQSPSQGSLLPEREAFLRERDLREKVEMQCAQMQAALDEQVGGQESEPGLHFTFASGVGPASFGRSNSFPLWVMMMGVLKLSVA